MEFSLECIKAGVQPIIGTRILLGDEEYHLILLVQSEQGYLNLSELLTQSYLQSDGTNRPRITWGMLEPFGGAYLSYWRAKRANWTTLAAPATRAGGREARHASPHIR